MNNLFAIGIILVVFVLTVVLTKKLSRIIPRWIKILVFIILFLLLVYFIIKYITEAPGGSGGLVSEQNTSEIEDNYVINADFLPLENCILLYNDEIWIEGQVSSIERAEEYINERVYSNTNIILVDDYSSSKLIHSIIGICKNKGAHFTLENETYGKE